MWQPNTFGARHERLGTVGSGGEGVTVAASTTISWVDIGGATSFPYEAITLCFESFGTGGADYLMDVGISDGSNRWLLINDLHFAAAKLTAEHTIGLTIPVHVPAGAQLSCSARVAAGSGSTRVAFLGHSSGVGGAPGFSRCVALFTPTSARGIAIDPGATANTKGSWTEMTSSCPENIGAMFGLVGFNGDTTRAATASALIDIGIGAASSEFVLYPNASLAWGATRDGPSNCPRIPLFACDVAKTTRIAARGACSITTAGDRTFDLALYGLVK